MLKNAPSNPSGGSDSDYQGILAQYQNQQNDPYYSAWKKDLDAGKLAGTPLWFFEKFKEQKQGEEAIAKQADVQKQLAAAGYGLQSNQLQAGLMGSGLAKSGFAGDEMNNLSAAENMTFSDLYNRMLDMQQNFRHGLNDRWQQESFMRKADREAKKNRKFQIASAGLGAAGSLLRFV